MNSHHIQHRKLEFASQFCVYDSFWKLRTVKFTFVRLVRWESKEKKTSHNYLSRYVDNTCTLIMSRTCVYHTLRNDTRSTKTIVNLLMFIMKTQTYNFCTLERVSNWTVISRWISIKSKHLGEPFFVSRRFASRIHEISDLKKALVLSLRAECTRFRGKRLNMRGTLNR